MSRKTRIRGRKFTVVLDKDEDGGYSVQCAELPAAISQGDTKKEALKNIKEAIELVLEVLEEKVRKQKPKSELEEVVV
ncbi:MAG: type II toxin-antitoxin system HicB family antitoxin [Nitrososphaerales archaeon]